MRHDEGLRLRGVRDESCSILERPSVLSVSHRCRRHDLVARPERPRRRRANRGSHTCRNGASTRNSTTVPRLWDRHLTLVGTYNRIGRHRGRKHLDRPARNQLRRPGGHGSGHRLEAVPVRYNGRYRLIGIDERVLIGGGLFSVNAHPNYDKVHVHSLHSIGSEIRTLEIG